jgi:hypothetical protein
MSTRTNRKTVDNPGYRRNSAHRVSRVREAPSKKLLGTIAEELRAHAPFTLVGALTGIIRLFVLRCVDPVLCQRYRISFVVFQHRQMGAGKMSIWTLMIREIAYRKLNFVLALVGVAAAVGLLIGVLTCLHLHDARSEEIVARQQAETGATMAALKADVKRAMHRLGYNAIILPKDQSLGDWYAQDYASRTMAESWASRLADTKDLVDRYLPRLRQKLKWDEKQWTIIVVGVGHERVLDTSVCEVATLVDTIPRGSCVVGYELHDALSLGGGDEIAIRGRTFRVSRCAEESGQHAGLHCRTNGPKPNLRRSWWYAPGPCNAKAARIDGRGIGAIWSAKGGFGPLHGDTGGDLFVVTISLGVLRILGGCSFRS